MTKKIAVINDLSGFGRCSLTAAISVISAMGVQPCPLPTAILSAQTGYPSYFYDDYTEKMGCFREEWEKMGVSFDGIYTGFMSGCRQIKKTIEFLDTFQKPDTFLMVDPIMGDGGERFALFAPEFQRDMKEIAARADIITPNLTELCLLADTDEEFMRDITGAGGMIPECDEVKEKAEELAHSVMEWGPSEVIVTGIRFRDNVTGELQMGNLAVSKKFAVMHSQPMIGGSYSGTGDLFASVVAGGKARNDSLSDSVRLAGEFIGCAVSDALRDGIPRDEGVEYEKYLWMLQSNLHK